MSPRFASKLTVPSYPISFREPRIFRTSSPKRPGGEAVRHLPPGARDGQRVTFLTLEDEKDLVNLAVWRIQGRFPYR
jgi:hypothetical protein